MGGFKRVGEDTYWEFFKSKVMKSAISFMGGFKRAREDIKNFLRAMSWNLQFLHGWIQKGWEDTYWEFFKRKVMKSTLIFLKWIIWLLTLHLKRIFQKFTPFLYYSIDLGFNISPILIFLNWFRYVRGEFLLTFSLTSFQFIITGRTWKKITKWN